MISNKTKTKLAKYLSDLEVEGDICIINDRLSWHKIIEFFFKEKE